MRQAWWGAVALALAAPVMAQQPMEAADSTARGLEAQYAAALVRERRLADDREQNLLNEAEARLIHARAGFDRQLSGAAAELEAARAEFARLSAEYAMRDAVARTEIETYRAEARGLVAQATPERLEALQRFADGDRVGAWPILEQLRLVEDRAIEFSANARRAVRWREDAQLRMIMRDNGEATTEDVLAMWEEAARLDPHDFTSAFNVARAHRQLGHSLEANDWLRRVLTLANELNLDSRTTAMIAQEMDAVLGRSESGSVQGLAADAIEDARRALAQEPSSTSAMIGLANALRLAPNPMLDEAESLARRALELTPNDTQTQLALAFILMDRAHAASGADAVRVGRQALDVGRVAAVSAMSPAPVRVGSARLYRLQGDLLRNAGQADQATAHYRRAETLTRSIQAQDPSVENLANWAEAIDSLGWMLEEAGAAPEAASLYAEALQALDALPETQALGPQTARWDAIIRLASARAAVFFGGDTSAAAEQLSRAALIMQALRTFYVEQPGQAPNTHYLGDIYHTQAVMAYRAGDFSNASRLANLALAEAPTEPAYLRTRAVISTRMEGAGANPE